MSGAEANGYWKSSMGLEEEGLSWTGEGDWGGRPMLSDEH